MRLRLLVPRLLVITGLVLGLLGQPGVTAAREALSVPDGFSDQLLANISRPTGLAFTPDGRLLITTQTGQLWVYQDGNLQLPVALDLTPVLCSNWERGLAGVAVDPNFDSNQHIYLYYTYKKFGECPLGNNLGTTNPVNRVSRFTLSGSNTVLTSTEVVLIDNIAQPSGAHNGGDLHFGADGLLYVSTGDSGIRANAAALNLPVGKILRIAPDGSIPPSNPYAGAVGSRTCGDPAGVPPGSGPCREVFALGLRNPFRMAFRPGTNEFYLNDVGESTWEEINLGAVGANYGWPVREGPCPLSAPNCNPATNPNPVGVTAPIHYYHHNTGCPSITGGAFVPAGIWPAEYDHAYLFGDFGCGKIRRLVGAGPASTALDFATGLGANSVVALRFGPHGSTQALYYLTLQGAAFGAPGGQLRRITYTGAANQPPVAVLNATPVYGAAPLAVTLSAVGSADPDAGNTLVYDWDLGDGTVLNGTSSLTQTHLYPAGLYTPTLRVRDNRGAASQWVSLRIDSGNTPPVPVMERVGPDEPFAVGEQLAWEATATDNEDASEALTFSWEARLHHVDAALPGNAHFHPYLAPTPGSSLVFSAPPPEDFGATALSYVELRLTAADSWGLTGVVTRALTARQVPVSFAAEPAGRELLLRGQVIVPPHAATSWENWAFELAAPLQTDPQGGRWGWQAWEVGEGLTATRTITTGAEPAAYTATFAATDQAPVPQVTLLDPPGGPSNGLDTAFTLTVTGKNFAADALVVWDGVALTSTTFVSSTQLQAVVGAGHRLQPGPLPVSAFNPAPAGGMAEPISFLSWWRRWLPLLRRGP